MRHSIIRAYQAVEHELADLIADVDSEDATVYMPHASDEGMWERRLAEAYAQEEGLSWEN